MKKAIALMLTVLIFLSGCSSSGSISTFTAGVAVMPSNFDPRIATQEQDILVITNIYDGLFEKRDGAIEKNMVTDYSVSSDGRTYTFTIREDSRYHIKGNSSFNGHPVTARDFVFAFRRVCDPATKSPYIDDFSNIRNAAAVRNGASVNTLGVRSDGPYKLIIELEEPDSAFIDRLCSSAVYPCCEEFFNTCKGAYGLNIDTTLGNGPFRINYLDPEGGNATIVRADDKKGMIDRIRIYKLDDLEMPAAFERGDISGYFSSSPSTARDSVSTGYDTDVLMLVFNRSDRYFSNANIRQALSWYAFGFINSGANMNAVDPHGSIFPDTVSINGRSLNSLIALPTPSYLEDDPVRLINQGMYEAGDRKPSERTLLIPSDSRYSPVFENINQLWQRDLVQYFKVEYLAGSEISRRVASGDYDIAFVSLTPANDTAYGVLDLFGDIAHVNECLTIARSTLDESIAMTQFQSARRYIISNAYAVPMGRERSAFNYKRYFTGIYADPFTRSVNLKYAKAN